MIRKVSRSRMIIAVACLVPCIVLTWWGLSNGHPGPAEAYGLIHPGINRQEVASLLGRPGKKRDEFSSWLNNRSVLFAAGNDLINGSRLQPDIEYWYQDSGILILSFEANGRVADKQLLRVDVSTWRQWVNRLIERLGL